MEDIWDIKRIRQVLSQEYPSLSIDRVSEINEKEGKPRLSGIIKSFAKYD